MLERLLHHSLVSKAEFAASEGDLRVDLINAQYDLKDADFPVLILVAGNDRIATEELAQLLHGWLDARHLVTRAFDEPSGVEREFPAFWRYWCALPARGRIGLFLGAWPLAALSDRNAKRLDRQGFAMMLGQIRRFEEELVADGVLLLKFWVHTPHGDLRQRLGKARKSDAAGWQVELLHRSLELATVKALRQVELMLESTSTVHAPWTLIDGRDQRTRDHGVMTVLRDALTARLATHPPELPAEQSPPKLHSSTPLRSLARLTPVPEDRYELRLEALQRELGHLTGMARDRGQATILLFEGWDAAGKGGVIRRITQGMSFRDYQLVPISAPTPEEASHHYLWRFWRRLPATGGMTIFDRSWYGRVLVERVERFARPAEWQRAFAEINDFETQLRSHGYLVLKFFLHIDPDEQARRFLAREQTPYKKYKITAEDYRNRSRRDEYHAAVDEMIVRTSAPDRPWQLIDANDKRAARLEVLERVCAGLGRACD